MTIRRSWPFLLLAALAALTLAFAACGDDDDGGEASSGGMTDGPGASTPMGDDGEESALNVQVASYEPLVGTDNRFIVGALTPDNEFVSYGTAELRFFYLGTRDEPQDAEPFGGPVSARFIAVPGEGRADPPDTPVVAPASEGRGVYLAEGIEFDRAGFWGVALSADLPEGRASGTAAFEVYAEARVPAPGEPALPTRNPTIDSTDVEPRAIDSRAITEGAIPDPELHTMSIADAIASGRPTVIVFATPVFCVSQFCGPVTDMIAELQADYGDGVNFVHIEIWDDFEQRRANPWAEEWLATEAGLTEPWFFLVGSDGIIVERWDNLASRDEIESAILDLTG